MIHGVRNYLTAIVLACMLSLIPESPALAQAQTFRPVNITSATTTLVHTGAGTLNNLCVNTPTSSGTITIYDSLTASGTKLGTITLPSTITSLPPSCLPYNDAFQTGLTIVTTGTNDITVGWSLP